MLHPAAHLPQQSPIMVDLHDQVTEQEQPDGKISDNIYWTRFAVFFDQMYSNSNVQI